MRALSVNAGLLQEYDDGFGDLTRVYNLGGAVLLVRPNQVGFTLLVPSDKDQNQFNAYAFGSDAASLTNMAALLAETTRLGELLGERGVVATVIDVHPYFKHADFASLQSLLASFEQACSESASDIDNKLAQVIQHHAPLIKVDAPSQHHASLIKVDVPSQHHAMLRSLPPVGDLLKELQRAYWAIVKNSAVLDPDHEALDLAAVKKVEEFTLAIFRLRFSSTSQKPTADRLLWRSVKPVLYPCLLHIVTICSSTYFQNNIDSPSLRGLYDALRNFLLLFKDGNPFFVHTKSLLSDSELARFIRFIQIFSEPVPEPVTSSLTNPSCQFGGESLAPIVDMPSIPEIVISSPPNSGYQFGEPLTLINEAEDEEEETYFGPTQGGRLSPRNTVNSSHGPGIFSVVAAAAPPQQEQAAASPSRFARCSHTTV